MTLTPKISALPTKKTARDKERETRGKTSTVQALQQALRSCNAPEEVEVRILVQASLVHTSGRFHVAPKSLKSAMEATPRSLRSVSVGAKLGCTPKGAYGNTAF